MTQTLLPGTRKVYEQLLWRDFNPRDTPPITACGQVLQQHILVERTREVPALTIPAKKYQFPKVEKTAVLGCGIARPDHQPECEN